MVLRSLAASSPRRRLELTVHTRLIGRRSGRRHLTTAIGRGEARTVGAGVGRGRGLAHTEFVRALDEVDRLRRSGLRGAALTRAIERIGRQLNLPTR